ncbi:hypothetical protein FRB94_011202 [Tulasnella sp. JGI-2019a]|nr:hypothetical protein FRB94_011202 [Tulasnella sp. JGI-2019a]
MSSWGGSELLLPAPNNLRVLPRQRTRIQPILQSVSATSHGTIKHKLDEKDNGCIITNIHRHTDSLAHLVNAQRSSKMKKKLVESAFMALGIAHPKFDLDEMSNTVWLDRTLHAGLDEYGLFALTVSKETGTQLLGLLKNDLEFRQKLLDDHDVLSARNSKLFVSTGAANPLPECITRPQLQLVLLHPEQFLPDGLPLIRRRSRAEAIYDTYTITQDGRLRCTTDAANVTAREFPIEQQETTRSGVEIVNVWMLILNANAKFKFYQQRYGFQHPHLPDSIIEVITLTMDITRLIYSKPEPTPGVSSTALSRTRWLNPRPDDAEDGDSDESRSQGPDGSSHSGDGGGGDVTGSNVQGASDVPQNKLDLFLSLPPDEMEQMGNEWFCGYDRLVANHDELFGRPPDSAYKSPDRIMQWLTEVV